MTVPSAPLPPRRRGPRGAEGGDTRAALLEAARAEFAERGYRAATLRSIGARAGVDPAMISHYFGGKAGLFAEVTALALDPVLLIRQALSSAASSPAEALDPAAGSPHRDGSEAGGSEGGGCDPRASRTQAEPAAGLPADAVVGQRLALFFLNLWEEPGFRDPALAVFRSALADPAQARAFREYLEDNLLPLIRAHGRGPAPRRSAALAMSHLLGIVLARHVMGIGELRTATPAELAAAVGPVLQGYMEGPVGHP